MLRYEEVDASHSSIVVRHKASGRELIQKKYGKCGMKKEGELLGRDWRERLRGVLGITCPFVVKLVDFFEDEESVSVVLEIVGNWRVEDWIEGKKRDGGSFSEEVC